MGNRVSLAAGLIAMVAWLVVGVFMPLGAGWVHLLLGAGIMLLIRAIVMWPTPQPGP